MLLTLTLAAPIAYLISCLGLDVSPWTVLIVEIAVAVIVFSRYYFAKSAESAAPSKRGDIALIYGPSGAGKTALFGQVRSFVS